MHHELVDAASRSLGSALSQPVQLVGGDRTTVVRCRTTDGGTVVVKAYRRAPDALSGFTAEAAGLALGVAGPQLLAVDTRFPLVVMEDLGSAPSLADLLLGDDAPAARDAVLTWAAELGRLAATTAGREPELARLRRRYDLGHSYWNPGWHAERCAELPGLLSDLGVRPPTGLDDDLDEVLTVADPTTYPVFSPGDTCPDNNLLTAGGLRVFDFEGASYHCVFLGAAYTVMPFSTCWCVFRMPPGLTDRVEAAYRAEVVRAYPVLADEALWRSGVRRAVALWTIDITTLLLPTVAITDRVAHRTRRPVATWRQILRYRWQHLADELDGAGELGALATSVRGLLTTTEPWDVAPLPLYPAWR